MDLSKVLFVTVICIAIAYFVRGVFVRPQYTLTALAILALFAGTGTSLWGCIHEDTIRLAFGATMLGFSGLCFIAAAIRGKADPSATKTTSTTRDNPTER
jgi:hypothetical protein